MNNRINLQKPVMEFYEEGDWLRIEVPGKPTRYLPKLIAMKLLFKIGQHAVTQRSNIIVREKEIIV